ncbi:hypothetical protein, partial [Listeria newyorkensis]|uniref:hypothetical protein n=1 Tax=Listeria newyorkensis TaxID=1497681 RepID=UPI0011804DDB
MKDEYYRRNTVSYFYIWIEVDHGTVSYVYVHAFPADGWNLFWVALFVVLLMMIVSGAVWLYMSINFLAFIVYPLVLLLFGFVLVFLAGYALYLG